MRENANKKKKSYKKLHKKRAGQMLEKSRKAEQKRVLQHDNAQERKAFISGQC